MNPGIIAAVIGYVGTGWLGYLAGKAVTTNKGKWLLGIYQRQAQVNHQALVRAYTEIEALQAVPAPQAHHDSGQANQRDVAPLKIDPVACSVPPAIPSKQDRAKDGRFAGVRLTDADRETMLYYRALGWTYRVIASAFDCSPRTVARVCRGDT
jgi:DNA-directed RNA polymerase specialized sigma24 family protein